MVADRRLPLRRREGNGALGPHGQSNLTSLRSGPRPLKPFPRCGKRWRRPAAGRTGINRALILHSCSLHVLGRQYSRILLKSKRVLWSAALTLQRVLILSPSKAQHVNKKPRRAAGRLRPDGGACWFKCMPRRGRRQGNWSKGCTRNPLALCVRKVITLPPPRGMPTFCVCTRSKGAGGMGLDPLPNGCYSEARWQEQQTAAARPPIRSA